jgi:hypothetical protein
VLCRALVSHQQSWLKRLDSLRESLLNVNGTTDTVLSGTQGQLNLAAAAAAGGGGGCIRPSSSSEMRMRQQQQDTACYRICRVTSWAPASEQKPLLRTRLVVVSCCPGQCPQRQHAVSTAGSFARCTSLAPPAECAIASSPSTHAG